MTLKNKILKTIEEAAKSKHRKFKLAAIVWQGSKVIGIGHNHYNIDFATKPGKRKGGIHAEALAIVRANSNKAKWKHTIITVARVGKRGNILEAKPCKDCMRLIEKMGIDKVYWTTERK